MSTRHVPNRRSLTKRLQTVQAIRVNVKKPLELAPSHRPSTHNRQMDWEDDVLGLTFHVKLNQEDVRPSRTFEPGPRPSLVPLSTLTTSCSCSGRVQPRTELCIARRSVLLAIHRPPDGAMCDATQHGITRRPRPIKADT
jgi:hypothetical protein